MCNFNILFFANGKRLLFLNENMETSEMLMRFNRMLGLSPMVMTAKPREYKPAIENRNISRENRRGTERYD